MTAQKVEKTAFEGLQKVANDSVNGMKDFVSEKNREELKKTTLAQYIRLQVTYAKTHYGMYTAGVIALATAGLVLAASTGLLPTFAILSVPAITTAWLKYTAAAFVAAVAGFGLYTIVPRTYSEAKKLLTRIDANETSKHDAVLLGTIAIMGGALATMMYAFPTLTLGLGALNPMTKAAVAGTIGVVTSAPSAYAGFKYFFAKPAGSGSGSAAGSTVRADDSRDNILTAQM